MAYKQSRAQKTTGNRREKRFATVYFVAPVIEDSVSLSWLIILRLVSTFVDTFCLKIFFGECVEFRPMHKALGSDVMCIRSDFILRFPVVR